MIIKRKMFAAIVENPTTMQKLSPSFRMRQNSARWKEFNKETTGKAGTFRTNTGQTRKEFEAWQQSKYGNKI